MTVFSLPAVQEVSLRDFMQGMDSMTVRDEETQVALCFRPGPKDNMNEFVKISSETLEKMLNALLWFEKIRPLLQVAREAHPKNDPFLDNLPVQLVTLPARYYLEENGLEDVKAVAIETHRAPFLDFFHAFVAEWKALGGEVREDESAVFRVLGQALSRKGILRGRVDEELQEYSKILQTHAFLNLATVNTKRTPIVFDNLTKQAKANGKGITVLDSRIISQKEKDAEIKSAFERTLTKINNLTALKVLDLYRMEQANTRPYGNPSTRFRLNVMDYMKRCDIKMTPESYKRTQRRLIEVARAWYEVSISLEDEGEARAARLLQEKAESKGGYIEYWFTERLAGYLAKGYISHYHLSLLRTDERNPNAFFIGNKLQLHYGILNNHEHGTECIISVKSLTEELETKGTLPTFEEVKAGKRQYTQRIVRPFEAALNSVEFLDKWEYCNAKKKPLTKAQKARFTYATFADCYIKFTLKDPPDLTQALKDKQERDAEKAERIAARKKKRQQKDTVT